MHNIHNLEALEAAIRQQQQLLKRQEADLLTCWQQLPTEAVKAAVTGVVGFAFNQLVVGNVWNMVTQIWSLLRNPTKIAATNTTSPIAAWAKKIGAIAALRLAAKFLSKN